VPPTYSAEDQQSPALPSAHNPPITFCHWRDDHLHSFNFQFSTCIKCSQKGHLEHFLPSSPFPDQHSAVMKRRASLIVATLLCCLQSVSSSPNEILCGQQDTFNSTLGNFTGNTMVTKSQVTFTYRCIVSADVWNPDSTGGQCLSVRKSLILALDFVRANFNRCVPMARHSTPHGTGCPGQTPSIPTPTSPSTRTLCLCRSRTYQASPFKAVGICSRHLRAARIRGWEVLI
jgi:hypothetical protein